MKKSVTFFIAVGCAMAITGKVCAQDTLWPWNLFHPNDIIVYGNSDQTLAPNVTPGNSGLGQTWIFTTVAFEYLDTLHVVAPNNVPSQYTAAFPQSSFALYYGSDQTVFDFATTDGSSLFLDGTAALDQNFGVLSQKFSDPLEYLQWPMMYGISFLDTAYSNWKYPTTGPSDSAWEISTVVLTTQVDAQGTLITSYGSYDIIRVRRDYEYWVQYATHNASTGWSSFSPLNYVTREYEWWTDSVHIGWKVASMQVNPANDAVQNYKIQTDYTIGIPVYTQDHSFSLYPDPAADFIFVSGETNSRWEIRDINGSIVNSGVLRSKTEEIDISSLAAGVYVLEVANENGMRGARKFVHL